MLKHITCDGPKADEMLVSAIALADPNALRMALYHATRDPELAAMTTELSPFWGGAFNVVALAKEYHAAVCAKAVDFLRNPYREFAPTPNDVELRAMMDMFAGQRVSDLAYEVGRGNLTDAEFPLGVEWTDEPPAEVKQRFKVVVIGAGFGGMAAAIQLQLLGIPFEIIERHGGFGGTWWRNNYPEARVDIASHHYQCSYMRGHPWQHWFATRPELADYALKIAQNYGLDRHARLNTEVISAHWDEGSATWVVGLKGMNGEETITANAMISAAGLFNAANMPDIAGIGDFRGEIFHTTQWNPRYDYSGKKIGLIGVGSTGAQLMPEMARKGERLTVYQRSPQWVSEIPGYRDRIPDPVQWLFVKFPLYRAWVDFSSFYTIMAGDPEGVQNVDRAWQAQGGAVSRRNDAMRVHNIEYIRSKIGHRPDLMEKCVPDFPPFAKRPVVDNGWFDALMHDNVELVTTGIDRILPNGIRTKDGEEREHDFIILGAGFKAEEYLWPVHYVGRGGHTLAEAWAKDGARAYLGISIAGFPNLFTLYGPNSQARGGGIITWLEIWARYAVRSIVHLIEAGKRAIDVKPEVQATYNVYMDAALDDSVWVLGHSYFINKHGRQAINMPWKPAEYYSWVRTPDFRKYYIT